MAGTSIIEHFYTILNYLNKVNDEIQEKGDIDIEEVKLQYRLEELKNGIQTDIEQIENMLANSLQKKEEDLSNQDISEDIKKLLEAMHDSAIEIHEHFLSICDMFIEYIETLNAEILPQIKERIDNGIFKLDELKSINDELSKILESHKYEN